MRPDQVAVPDRAASERFDVAAKMADGASQDRMPEMLQVLLAERFKLALHREQKERGIYALLVGKSGVKLPEVEAVPDPKSPNWVKAADAMRLNQKMTIAALANYLGRFAERPVVDFTELKGTYQIDMEIPVEDMIRAKNAVEGAMRPGSSASDPVDSPILRGDQRIPSTRSKARWKHCTRFNSEIPHEDANVSHISDRHRRRPAFGCRRGSDDVIACI